MKYWSQYSRENAVQGGMFVAGLALLGLAVGSFLNVVIHRLPLMIIGEGDGGAAAGGRFDLAWPPSACPRCGARIRPHDNIPVLSFLMLRGRCRACGAGISPRYPLVELLGAAAPVAFATAFHDPVALAAASVFAWFAIAILFIDLETRLIPDALSLPLLWVGLTVAATVHPFARADAAVIGAASGYAGFRAVAWLAERWFGKPALGGGDVKLGAALGAWLGWGGLPKALVLASGSGALVGLALILAARMDRRQPIPFGPFLVAGGLLTLGWGGALPF